MTLTQPEVIYAWDKSPETAKHAAEFAGQFIAQHSSYISHGEIQTGLSDDGETWVHDLSERYAEDFTDLGEDRDLLVARLPHGPIVGFAIVAWEETARRRFAVLEDMAVQPDMRSAGVGAGLLSMVDKAVAQRGVDWLFLESGRNNVRAHGFFERHGFKEISHVFAKKLTK